MRVLIIGEIHQLGLDVGYPLPQPPLFPSQGPGFPTHPIAPGGRPPYPSQGPGFPTHPIAPGGPYPDQGLPGQPPYPSQGPGFPTHPIAPGGGGGQPPYPSHGLPPFATQLPVFPWDPSQPPPPEAENKPVEPDQLFVVKWSPVYGWILVPVQDDDKPTVTPHKAAPKP